MANPRRTERIKLSATYINGIAIALFAIGVFAPILALLNGTSGTSTVGMIGCGVASLLLHALAWRTLRKLPDSDE